VVTEIVIAPPTAPAQSSGPDHAELSLDDIVQIVGNQVAAGKISRSALGSAIWKLQQIKLTIPVKKRTGIKAAETKAPHDAKRQHAKALLRENPSLKKREVMELARCGSKCAVLARQELVAAGEIKAA